MMKKTKIDWCDFTWNPVTGCRHTCEYCYARRLAQRFCGDVRLNKSSDRLQLDAPRGIKKSQQRTIIILNHVEEMLRYYRIACEQSGKDEELRRYRVIMAMYIDDDKMTAQDIAEKENIEARTVYKDITNAIKPLSALIFGIDSIKIE